MGLQSGLTHDTEAFVPPQHLQRCRYDDEGWSTCVYLQALAHEGQQVQHALDGHGAEASSIGTAPNVLPPAHKQQLLLSIPHTAMPCIEQHQ